MMEMSNFSKNLTKRKKEKIKNSPKNRRKKVYT